MLKLLVVFAILAVYLFALMMTMGGEWVVMIGCCEETMQKKLRPVTSETGESEGEELGTVRLRSRRHRKTPPSPMD